MIIPQFLKYVLYICFLILYCEVGIYYIVLLQCSWPILDENLNEITNPSHNIPLKVMLLADTHLLGSRKGHWFDKLRREWQMYRAFQTVMFIHNPDVIFVLGDLFDEGLWCSKSEFKYYIQRFHSLFKVPSEKKLFVVPGNHDMGFHYWLDDYLKHRFDTAFNITSVNMLTLKGNTFVLLNSMAMEDDGCDFCRAANKQLQKISNILYCSKEGKNNQHCNNVKKLQLSRPIFLQHFPMYRPSDEICKEPDSAPPNIKSQSFRERWECLSKEASAKIIKLLNPRIIFTGHTHYGCHIIHDKNIPEWTIPSFNWRNINNPSFILAVFTPDKFAVNKCYMPKENTVIITYIFGTVFLLVYIFFNLKSKIRLNIFRKCIRCK